MVKVYITSKHEHCFTAQNFTFKEAYSDADQRHHTNTIKTEYETSIHITVQHASYQESGILQ
jgi:hypothetical protein